VFPDSAIICTEVLIDQPNKLVIRYGLLQGTTKRSVVYKKGSYKEMQISEYLDKIKVPGIPFLYYVDDKQMIMESTGDPIKKNSVIPVSVLNTICYVHNATIGKIESIPFVGIHTEKTYYEELEDLQLILTTVLNGQHAEILFDNEMKAIIMESMYEISKYFYALQTTNCFSLIHFDLWSGNMLINQEGHGYSVIDWGKGAYGNPVFDLITFSDWRRSANFYYKHRIKNPAYQLNYDKFQLQCYIARTVKILSYLDWDLNVNNLVTKDMNNKVIKKVVTMRKAHIKRRLDEIRTNLFILKNLKPTEKAIL
jgi:hypothetical protein